MENRIDKQDLLDVMEQWNRFLKRKVHLIACGGTAMTLFGVKPSTKDIDFMVPILSEYDYLLKLLKTLGYEQTTQSGWQRQGDIFRFDIFGGNKIHTTELLESPIEKKNHHMLKEYSHLYLGILNEYDLIASKLIRGTEVDFNDCCMLVKFNRNINIERLKRHFDELVSYDISQDRVRDNINILIKQLCEEDIL
jgi:hypothetical protein